MGLLHIARVQIITVFDRVISVAWWYKWVLLTEFAVTCCERNLLVAKYLIEDVQLKERRFFPHNNCAILKKNNKIQKLPFKLLNIDSPTIYKYIFWGDKNLCGFMTEQKIDIYFVQLKGSTNLLEHVYSLSHHCCLFLGLNFCHYVLSLQPILDDRKKQIREFTK